MSSRQLWDSLMMNRQKPYPIEYITEDTTILMTCMTHFTMTQSMSISVRNTNGMV